MWSEGDKALLPNLIVPGVQKSGTTYFAELLSQHPDVFLPGIKEPSFFYSSTEGKKLMPNGELENFAIKTPRDYLDLYRRGAKQKWRMDASTGYFQSSKALDLIRQSCPDARVVILMRNPVSRVGSAYNFLRMRGFDDAESLAVALENELSRGPEDPRRFKSYLEPGFYARHLKRWLEAYGKERVEVLIFEEFVADTQEALKKILHFLDLESFTFDLDAHRNESARMTAPWMQRIHRLIYSGRHYDNPVRSLARSVFTPEYRNFLRNDVISRFVVSTGQKPAPMPQEWRLKLSEIYAEDIEELSRLLGRDLNCWREGQG